MPRLADPEAKQTRPLQLWKIARNAAWYGFLWKASLTSHGFAKTEQCRGKEVGAEEASCQAGLCCHFVPALERFHNQTTNKQGSDKNILLQQGLLHSTYTRYLFPFCFFLNCIRVYSINRSISCVAISHCLVWHMYEITFLELNRRQFLLHLRQASFIYRSICLRVDEIKGTCMICNIKLIFFSD